MKSNVRSTLKYISAIKNLRYRRFHIDDSYNIVVQFASNDFQSWIYNLYIDLGSGFNSLIIEVCLILSTVSSSANYWRVSHWWRHSVIKNGYLYPILVNRKWFNYLDVLITLHCSTSPLWPLDESYLRCYVHLAYLPPIDYFRIGILSDLSNYRQYALIFNLFPTSIFTLHWINNITKCWVIKAHK